MIHSAILALLLLQDFSHRGFLETRFSIYPQSTSNDAAHGVGDALFRYEPSVRFRGVQANAALDLRADTHHQTERRLDVSWRDGQVRRPLMSIRRASLTAHRGPVTIELGKQFVRWGKTDILTPTDRFAPRDYVGVIDNEFLGVTAARLTVEKAGETVDFVWSPVLTPSRLPLLNQRWFPPVLIPIVDKGSRFPGGSQYGVRWNHSGAVDYSASYFDGFDHLPAIDARLRIGVDGFEADVTRTYQRMRMAGGDVAVPLGIITLKGEAAYFTASGSAVSDYLLYVAQLERQAGEWSFVGGYAGTYVRDERPAAFAGERGLARTFLARADYTLDTNRRVAFEGAVRQSGDGVYVKGEYSQAFGAHWRATLGAVFIRGAADDFLGRYRRNSNGSVVLRYSF